MVDVDELHRIAHAWQCRALVAEARVARLMTALEPFARSWERYHDANLADGPHYRVAHELVRAQTELVDPEADNG